MVSDMPNQINCAITQCDKRDVSATNDLTWIKFKTWSKETKPNDNELKWKIISKYQKRKALDIKRR